MLRWLAPVLLVAAPLVSQQASFTRFGSGCLAPPMVMDASIDHVGLPHLGRSFAIDYLGLEGEMGAMRLIPVLLTGFSPAQTPIAATLLPQQRPGCTIWLKPEASLVMAQDPHRPGHFATRVWITVPRDPSVLGLAWIHQWLAYYLDCSQPNACTLEALGASDAAVCRIGL